MFRFLKRKHTASEAANELAKLSLQIEDNQLAIIRTVANELEVPYDKVETEYRHLHLYMFETVVQTISDECDAGESLQKAFREAVSNLAKEQGLGSNYWNERERRTAAYDIAWQDSNPGVAMTSALARQIKSEDALSDVIPLSLYCMNLLAPWVKYLRKIHIVKG